MTQSTNQMSDPTHEVMLSSPTGPTSEFHDDSTLDKDIFDGIEDIYEDLEALPPPPPSSTEDDIIEASRLNSSSSSSSSSVGLNDISNEESVECERGFCGLQSPKNSRLTDMWNIFKIHNYFEFEEDHEKKTQNEPPQKLRVIENGVNSRGRQIKVEVETKKVVTEEKDVSHDVCARDTILQHTIDENVVEDEQVKKDYPSIRDILRQKALFDSSKESEERRSVHVCGLENTIECTTDDCGARKENVKKFSSSMFGILRPKNLSFFTKEDNESNVVDARDTGIELNINEDAIRREKMKKYYPSFWDILGQRKLFGLSYRLLLLLFFNFFAFILLIILIASFTGRNKTGSDSLNSAANIDASIDVSTTVDEAAPISSDDDDGNDVSSELRALCEEDGVTSEDGVILTEDQVLEKGKFLCSPSKMYILGMMDDLAIVDIRANEVVWSAGASDGARTILQGDGSMVIENVKGEIIWNTEAISVSSDFFKRQLVFLENNEGVIAIQQIPAMGMTQTPAYFWMDGVPELDHCDNCQVDDLEFPVRGTFYTSTFDNTEISWQDKNGNRPMHYPDLGFYSSSDSDVVTAHIEAMEYGKINLAISSWMGPGMNYDRSRITMLLEETSKQNAGLKWTISYEKEPARRQSLEEFYSDLEYLKTWFVWHNSWAHIDGKPVIYVNSDGDCGDVERWTTATATEWYVVLRIFDGYDRCNHQPDSWYDQRIDYDNDGVDVKQGLYYNLAPGQWKSGRPRPGLERLSPREWCDHVEDMVDSNEQWQLIVSFNDAKLGTSIEPSPDWRSNSSYGYFLDCLHDPQMF